MAKQSRALIIIAVARIQVLSMAWTLLINFFIHGSKSYKIYVKGVFEEIGFRIWQLKEIRGVLKADQMLPTHRSGFT